MKKYIQTNLFDSGIRSALSLSSNLGKCWRCQQYYPISQIRVFSIRDIHGYIGDYQACEACHKVMTSSEEFGW